MKSVLSFVKRNNTIVFVLLLLCICIIAFEPSRSIDRVLFGQHDKPKHVLAFLVISYFLIENSFTRLSLYIKISILILFAFSIEVIQYLVGRSQIDFLDFLASVSGILIFLLLRYILKNYT